MPQNRNKLIGLFISNISNAVIHEILEKAIDAEDTIIKYQKEIKNSFEIAKAYRSRINPVEYPLPSRDIEEIRRGVINKVKKELNSRISKGYKNINLNSVEEVVDKFLREMKICE